MPLCALAVASYAIGLLLGFGGRGSATVFAGALLCATALIWRRLSVAACGILLVAGWIVATERTWHERACLRDLALRDAIAVELTVPAAPGSLARGRVVDDGCETRSAIAVRDGAAAAGALVNVTGTVYATGDGLLVKQASIRTLRGPSVFARARARASLALQRDFGPDAPLAKALLIAETADLGPEVRDRFATAGLVHILAISGLHVTIVATAVMLLLQAVRLPVRATLIGSAAITAAYVAMIGAPPAAIRAAVMFAVLVLSRLMQRPTSGWAALALGAAWPMPGDPRIVLHVGWQLSIAGVIALMTASDITRRFIAPRWKGWRRVLASQLVTGICATIVTAPVVAWYFGRTSLIAPLANIVAHPIANVLQPTLFLALALGPWPVASQWVADAARPGLRALDAVASHAAALPGAELGVAPTATGTLLAVVAVFAVITGFRARRPFVPLAACLCCLAGSLWLPLARSPSRELEFHAIDVGQGDALAVRTPRGRWVLMDAGRSWTGGDAGRRTVVPYIRRRGGDVVAFILSHPDEDHVGGAAAVLRALRPYQFWDGAYVAPNGSYAAALAVASGNAIEWHRARPGDTLRVDDVLFRVLAPDSAWVAMQRGPNEASAVVMVEYRQVRILLTGDAEAAEEQWILQHWDRRALRADVLKVGHHGSRTSSTAPFLDVVEPRIAVISSGAGNSYGHPHHLVVESLLERGALVLRTDELGSIVVATDGSHVRVAGGDGAWVLPP